MSEYGKTSYTLLQRALNLNDEEAWNQLHNHYKKFIYFLLHNMGVSSNDIDDLSQTVLASLTEKLKLYDPGRGKFRAWLKKFVTNQVLMHARKEKSLTSKLDKFTESQEINGVSQESALEERVEKEWESYIMRIALERVENTFKGESMRVFKLALEGKKASEIVELTGLETATVYTFKKRVKHQMTLEIRSIIRELEM